MFKIVGAAVAAVSLTIGGAAWGSSLPAVDESYEGNYALQNAFTSHGLWLPGFLGDRRWSVDSGLAEYSDGALSLDGTVSQTIGGTEYSMDFDIDLTETTDAPNGLVCGTATCNSATTEMRDNIVHFDMGDNPIMGTVTGTGLLDGLVMQLVMRPLDGNGRKPGQLGYGGNWRNLDFGYSNWLSWNVTQFAKVKTGSSGNGDINVDLIPAPLPAGLPLVLTGAMGFYAVRRRQKKAA